MNGLASYDRRPKETPKAWEAFVSYRDMGIERTHQAVADELKKGRAGIQKWSSRWSWKNRCRDYDDEQDRVLQHQQRQLALRAQAKEAKAVDAMIQRHASLADAMSRKVAQDLLTLTKETCTGCEECEGCGAGKVRLKPADMAKWIEVAAKLERVSRGLTPTGDRGPLVQINATTLIVQVNPKVLIRDDQARDLNAQLLRRLGVLDRARREEQQGRGSSSN